MFGGRIASDKKPHRTGGESDDGAHPKRRSPAVMNHDVSDDQRRQAGSRSHSGEDPAIRNTAFGGWNPACDELIGGGIDHRLPGAEKKTNSHEDEQRACNLRWDQGGQSGEDPPPRDARGQHTAWSEAIRQSPANGLEERIPDQHCAEHLPELYIAKMVGLRNRPAGNGNVYPIEIRHGTEDEQPEHQKPADMARSRTVHRKDFLVYAACSRKSRESWSATILSSPGCSMKEFMASPGRPSPVPITMLGFELRNSFDACSGVNEMRAASHVMLMCGT